MRPSSLPDYQAPPLSEVVLGVQFQEIQGYQQIHAGKVWDLFKQHFPIVQEQPSLDKQFELFGMQHQPPSGPVVRAFSVAPHPRYWFCSASGEYLIQFQQDRLLFNWRRHHDDTLEYPRYEQLRDRFSGYLTALNDFFSANFGECLRINQCEASYYNTIPALGDTADWVSIFREQSGIGTEFSFSNRHITLGTDGEPLGRLYVECAGGIARFNEKVLVLNITFRGMPKTESIEDALKLLDVARAEIVGKFDSATTSHAHKKWGKV